MRFDTQVLQPMAESVKARCVGTEVLGCGSPNRKEKLFTKISISLRRENPKVRGLNASPVAALVCRSKKELEVKECSVENLL